MIRRQANIPLIVIFRADGEILTARPAASVEAAKSFLAEVLAEVQAKITTANWRRKTADGAPKSVKRGRRNDARSSSSKFRSSRV